MRRSRLLYTGYCRWHPGRLLSVLPSKAGALRCMCCDLTIDNDQASTASKQIGQCELSSDSQTVVSDATRSRLSLVPSKRERKPVMPPSLKGEITMAIQVAMHISKLALPDEERHCTLRISSLVFPTFYLGVSLLAGMLPNHDKQLAACAIRSGEALGHSREDILEKHGSNCGSDSTANSHAFLCFTSVAGKLHVRMNCIVELGSGWYAYTADKSRHQLT